MEIAWETPRTTLGSYRKEEAPLLQADVAPFLPPRPPEPSRPKLVHPSQWKLRSPVGLVYDFPDLGALKNWLSTKDTVEGMLASKDGGQTWDMLRDLAELADCLPRKYLRFRPQTEAPERSWGVLTGQPKTVRPTARPGLAELPLEQTPSGPGTVSPGVSPTVTVGSTIARESDVTTILDSHGLGREAAGAPPGGSDRYTERAAASTRQWRLGEQPTPQSGQISALKTPPAPPRRVTSRPYSSVISSHHAKVRARAKKTVPWWTRVGLLVTAAILVAGGLQISGTYDVIGSFGLRSESTAELVSEEQPAEGVVPGQESVQSPAEVQAPGDRGPIVAALEPAAPTGQGSVPAMLEMQRQGLNPHQSRIDTLIYQARLAASEGRYDDAIEHVRIASQLDRGNPELTCLLAELYWQAGWFAEADHLQTQCNSMRDAATLAPSAAIPLAPPLSEGDAVQ